jgi:hypothetical protein
LTRFNALIAPFPGESAAMDQALDKDIIVADRSGPEERAA